MFQLHDTTRRRVCVAAFLAFGLLPTLLAGGWCAWRYAPGYVEAEAQRLGRQLGLQVKLGGLNYLRPGVVLYERLEASDPETGNAVLRCRLLEVAVGPCEDKQGRSRPVVTIRASQPEIEAASLTRAYQCLTRVLAGYAGPLAADLQFSTAELTLAADRNAQTFTDVEGLLETLPDRTSAQFRFRLAGGAMTQPMQVGAARSRQMPPASGFELSTGDGELPCHLLAMGIPELRPLGPDCRFRGHIRASQTLDGWQGEVTGELTNLDLGMLLSERSSYKLAGCGQATITSARFCDGRLEEGNAAVSVGPGTIDRSLIDAAVNHLGLLVPFGRLPDQQDIPFDQLAFGVTLDAQGLVLRGCCGQTEPGTVLRSGSVCLLGESPQPLVAVAALVQTLAPPNMIQVPASRQTSWLLQYLPVPEVTPPPGAASAPQRLGLRMRETRQQ